MAAYNRLPKIVYNEFDKNAAAWLRELIRRNLIAPGDVDERSIVDVAPDDLRGYTQCHFFAGIGVWSYALRLAGWPDDRPVWTGSPPCQPFSEAGKRRGLSDERHLWPANFHLIDVCRPDTFFGEQVASKDALAWLDHVSADVEGAGYAIGAFDLCAAGFGAPHIRQRLKFVATRALANASHQNGRTRERPAEARTRSNSFGWRGPAGGGPGSGLALPDDAFWRANLSRRYDDDRPNPGRPEDTSNFGLGGGSVERPGPTNGYWEDVDWLLCRDGKWRPVEPGSSPLAHGSPERVGRLRGYGNAIVAPGAAHFIAAFLDAEADGFADAGQLVDPALGDGRVIDLPVLGDDLLAL